MSHQQISPDQLRDPKLFALPANQGYTGWTVTLNYAESLTVGDPVYADGSTGVLKADANTAGKFPAIGMALETAASGNHLVLLFGIYRDDSLLALSAGLVYLSTSSALTQTQPTATDDCIQVIGVAISAHVLFVNPQLVYLTHA